MAINGQSHEMLSKTQHNAKMHVHWGLNIGSTHTEATSVSVQGGLGNRTSTLSSTDNEAVSVSVQEGVSVSVLYG